MLDSFLLGRKHFSFQVFHFDLVEQEGIPLWSTDGQIIARLLGSVIVSAKIVVVVASTRQGVGDVGPGGPIAVAYELC